MSKGSQRERQAASLYQRAGYATYRPATVRFGENDIFGLFDLLAVSPSDSRVRAVQVKSNGARGIRSWMRHTALWRRLGWVTEYAVPVDGEGWKLMQSHEDTYRTVYDERKDEDVGAHRDTPLNLVEGLVRYLEEDIDGAPGTVHEVRPQ